VKAREEKPEKVFQKPPSSYNDTILIDRSCIVYYFPDSMQLEKIRLVTDSAIFNSTMHEFEYLIKNARRAVSESKAVEGIPVREVLKARYLLFRGQGGDSCIDLNTRGDVIGIYLFKPSKWPRAVDLANIDTDLTAYFSGH
jgi:hypothetical protein